VPKVPYRLRLQRLAFYGDFLLVGHILRLWEWQLLALPSGLVLCIGNNDDTESLPSGDLSAERLPILVRQLPCWELVHGHGCHTVCFERVLTRRRVNVSQLPSGSLVHQRGFA